MDTVGEGERRGLPSASSIERLAACPGSWNLSKTAPPLPGNAWSEDGQLVHEALENVSTKLLPSRLVSTVETALELRGNILDQWLYDIRASQAYSVMNEWRFWFQDRCSAKCDVLIICGVNGLILDYKSLYGDIEEPARNAQLRTEVVCAATEMKLKSVRVAIIQPAKGLVPPADYDLGDIARAEAWLTRILDAIAQADAPLKPGTHCQYCPARTICPAVDKVKTELTLRPSYDLLTPDGRAKRIPLLKLGIKLAGEELEFYKAALKQDPDYVTGYCLTPGRTEKPVKDITELYVRVVGDGDKPHQLSVSEFMECCSVTKGKIEAKISEKCGVKGKALDELMDWIYSGILGTKQTEGSLAEKT